MQPRRQRLHLRPRLALVIARDEVRRLAADVFADEAEQLFPIRRAHDLRLAGLQIAEIDEHAPRAPRQPAVGRFALRDDVRLHVLRFARPADVRESDELLPALHRHDRAKRHHAHEAVALHRRPRFAFIGRNRLLHRAIRPLSRINDEPRHALRIGEAVDRRAIFHLPPVLRHRQFLAPRLAAIIAALQRPRRAAMAMRPHAKHRLAIRHQQRRRMALINLFRALAR
jgi:hypothetical protein